MLTQLLSEWLVWRGDSQGGVDKENVFYYNLNFFKVTCPIKPTCTEIATLLKENWEYFLAPKALTEVPEVQASSEVWGYGPPKKPWNFKLVSLKWQFLHFHIIFLWYSVRCLLLSQMSLGFSLLLLNQCSETERFLLLPLENHYKRKVHEADKNVIAFSGRQHWHGLCYTQ